MGSLGRAAEILGPRAQRDAPLGLRTTYRVGGTAALLLEAADEADLLLVAQAVRETGAPTLVIGRGSNLLVSDGGFEGIAVVLGEGFGRIDVDDTVVRAGASVPLPVLARRCVADGLTGMEWAVGVPGSVGGAVRMNAGGHGSETRDSLLRIRRFDLSTGDDGEVDARALELGYRRSAIGAADVVVWAEFGLSHAADPDACAAELTEIAKWRREHQPGGQNAGSIFTNPPGDSAGRLVEAAGCKGLRLGRAHVSAKHANFIQADVGGSADEILALIREVQRRVEVTTGVVLHTEVHLVGFPS